jgi:hypothetical protein
VRVAGNREGKKSNAMAMAMVTRTAGKSNGVEEVDGNGN